MFAINKKHWVWRVWFEIDSLLLCQIFFLSEAGDALGTAEDGTITRYDEETKEPGWWRRWTFHCIAIIWYYMLLLLCLPFPRFLVSCLLPRIAVRPWQIAVGSPGHGLCRSVSFSFHLATTCDEDLADEKGTDPESLWVTVSHRPWSESSLKLSWFGAPAGRSEDEH